MSKVFKVDWVLKNKIAISAAPQYIEDIKSLSQIGIKSIFTLCEEEKCYPKISDFFIQKVYTLPDHRKGKPPSSEELNYCVDIIDDLKEFQPTLVHCYAGMERSPLVCIAYLMKEKNITKQVALEYLMQVHPGTSPLPEQLDVLNYLT